MPRRGRHRPTVVTWREYLRQVYDHEGFPTFPDLNLLAEGDSWFTISGIPRNFSKTQGMAEAAAARSRIMSGNSGTVPSCLMRSPR